MRALGYIDLPSGSAIFQILIAGLLGISVAFRSFWRKVWHLLTGRGRGASAASPNGQRAAHTQGDSGSEVEAPAGSDRGTRSPGD
jgi:hypothetical protein